MGCQYCHRNLQTIDEIDAPPPPKSKPIIKARNLVKILFEEDNLYRIAWNYIKLFNYEQFQNLFIGNCKYKNYP